MQVRGQVLCQRQGWSLFRPAVRFGLAPVNAEPHVLVTLRSSIKSQNKDFSHHLFEMFLYKLEVLGRKLVEWCHFLHDFFFAMLTLLLTGVQVRDDFGLRVDY